MDTIFTSPTGYRTTILRDHPSHAKVQPLAVQRDYLHFSVIFERPWVMVQPRESNPRPLTLQSCALPTELIPLVQSETQNCKISKYVHRNTSLQSWRVPAAWCSQIKHYTAVLSYRFRPVYMTKSSPEKEGHPPAESTEKIVDFFVRANCTRTYFDCLALTELTQLDESKCLYGETLDQRGRWPYLHKRMNRRLGESPF